MSQLAWDHVVSLFILFYWLCLTTNQLLVSQSQKQCVMHRGVT
jgi:hypothetical protein